MNESEVRSGIRTVTHAARYWEELKAAAHELTLRFEAERRGYFSPDEEDATLALLVSYWQTRNALFDLIIALRAEFQDDEPPPSAFLIGFASALLLVDAARFLREIAGPRQLLIAKLNQPAIQFGIPAGVYDTVQKSLVSARNGWRLLDASEHYRNRFEEMHSSDSEHAELVEIVERLLPRIDVSVLNFTRAKFRTRGRQIAGRIGSRVFGRALYAFQQVIGSLAAEKYLRLGHRPRLPDEVASDVRSLLLPGDILIVRKEFALTNYFLPGYWPHAALYLGTESQLRALGIETDSHVQQRWGKLTQLALHGGVVLESMKDGVHLRSLDSPFRADSIVILRPRMAPADIRRAVARVLVHEGKPYDFDFDFRRSDRLVCTEVIYRAYDGIGGQNLPLVRRAGRPTLAGGDLIRLAVSNGPFAPVLAFAPRLVPGMQFGEQAVGVLRAGCRNQDSAAEPG